MWTAPEWLRSEGQGSQPGDVFSFSIVLQEIITREEPYAMCNLEPQG